MDTALLFPLTEKRCPRCKITWPLPSGFRRGSKKGGVAIYCRDCEDGYHKQRRVAARDIAVTRVQTHGKPCIRCGEHKGASEFAPSNHTLDGWAQRCAACRAELEAASDIRRRLRKPTPEKARLKQIKYKYGVTEAQFLSMMLAQASACGICKTPFVETRGVCVDHCHETGKIRGLLCHPCNTAIGFLKDSPTICRLAAEHLERA